MPDQLDLTPSYAQASLVQADKPGVWQLLLSKEGRLGSLRIHQDVDVYVAFLSAEDSLVFPTMAQRMQWLQLVRGSVHLNGQQLLVGDGAAVCAETIQLDRADAAEVLLFDMLAR